MTDSQDTYPAPADGWVCFHCGVRLWTPVAAREHFGERPTARPACHLTDDELRAAVRMYREIEEIGGIPMRYG